jgi:hypothetical protein
MTLTGVSTMYRRATHEWTKTAAIGVVVLSTMLMAGCKLDFAAATGGATELDRISLSGPSTVQVGDTIRLTASGSVTGLAGLLFLDPIRDGEFSVSDATIASILPFNPPPGDTTSLASVRVKGLKAGSVQVTVRARGKSDTHSIAVTPIGGN